MTSLPTKEDLHNAISVFERIGEANQTEHSSDKEGDRIYDKSYLKMLKSAFTSFGTTHKFKLGQIVKWKVNMRNKRIPHMSQPAIVVEIFKEPILDENAMVGSTYYREPLDIVLGIFANDGNFVTFYYDSRRFEPYS
ncbi:MAG: hypothetical protein WC647_18185 [Desulfomonilaceae bacterium]